MTVFKIIVFFLAAIGFNVSAMETPNDLNADLSSDFENIMPKTLKHSADFMILQKFKKADKNILTFIKKNYPQNVAKKFSYKKILKTVHDIYQSCEKAVDNDMQFFDPRFSKEEYLRAMILGKIWWEFYYPVHENLWNV